MKLGVKRERNSGQSPRPKQHSAFVWSVPSHSLPFRDLGTLCTGPRRSAVAPLAATHSCVSPALIAVSAQPFQGSLHLELHILSGKSVPCHGKATDGLGCHFHDNWVIRREEVPKIICKSADSGGIPTFHSYEAG